MSNEETKALPVAPEVIDGELMTMTQTKELTVEEANEFIKSVQKNTEAIRLIAKTAVGLTDARHWIDQSGHPMLWGDGGSIIAGAFGIDFIPHTNAFHNHPLGDGTGDYVVTYQMTADWKRLGRRIPVIGTASSKLGLYTRGGDREADLGDLFKHAMANAASRAVSLLVGLRTLTWKEIEEWTDKRITQGMCTGVSRKGDTDRKTADQMKDSGFDVEVHRTKIKEMLLKMCDNDEDAAKDRLEEVTTWKNKEGKLIKGKRSTTDLSPSQVPLIYDKIKKMFDDQEQQMSKGVGDE